MPRLPLFRVVLASVTPYYLFLERARLLLASAVSLLRLPLGDVAWP